MRWHIQLCLVLLALLIPTPVQAATSSSANITITATGYICNAPGGFTITYISDTELELSWTPGVGANNTMVRAAYGREPESRTDGYLVYYGNATVASDTALNLDEVASPIYYRAWSQSASGAWEETGSSDFLEGPALKLIAFVILCMSVMIWGWRIKKVSVLFISLMCWMGFAAYMYSIGSASWDYYRIFALVGVGMSVLCVFQVINVYKLRPGPEPETDAGQAFADDFGKMSDQINAMRMLRPRRRHRP